MMDQIFLTVLNMSITATYVLLVVLILRLLLKRAPKWISYALWSIVLIRLVCPVSFIASFSLLGRLFKPTNGGSVQYIPSNIGNMSVPAIDIGIPGINKVINDAFPGAAQPASANPLQVWVGIMAMIWAAGFLVMLIYSILSYRQLRHRINTATRIAGNVFETDKIDSPFVCGLRNPKIYLPVGMDEMDQSYVLHHEQMHLRRFDHVIKPLAFLVLSIHWFNPFMWIAFRLMSRDMEMSCDECVVSDMSREEKANYGDTLVRLAMKHPIFTGSPLSFGESGTKGRVRNILNYRRPSFWVIIVLVLAMILVGAGLLANPPTVLILDANEVMSIEMEQFNDGVSFENVLITDRSKIESVVDNLLKSVQTIRLTTSKITDRYNYLIIKLNLADHKRTLYLYAEGNSDFIEEPSLGVFRINRDSSVVIYQVYTGQFSRIITTETSGEINEEKAIVIAQQRFDEYLLERPEMKVKDPVYTAIKKQYKDKTEYWSVTIKLNEPEYLYHHFEVLITMDGEKVTLATG